MNKHELYKLWLGFKRWLFVENDSYADYEKAFEPKPEPIHTRGFTWSHYYYILHSEGSEWVIDCYRKSKHLKRELQTDSEETANVTFDRIVRNLSKRPIY